MKQKETEQICLSINKDCDFTHKTIPPQSSSYKAFALSVEIVESLSDYLIISILLVSVIVRVYEITSYYKDYNICFDAHCFQIFIRFIPLIVFSVPFILSIYLKRKLIDFDLIFLSPNAERPIIPPVAKPSSPSKLHIATRPLHPNFSISDYPLNEASKILDRLNEDAFQGLKINILRAVLCKQFTNAEFLTKIQLSFHLHRQQIRLYTFLLLTTAWFVCFGDDKIPFTSRNALLTTGFLWWLWSYYLYRRQIESLKQWLEKSRDRSLSIHLPLFMWDPEIRDWIELLPNDLHRPFIGDYGIGSEKIITLAHSTLLTMYILFFLYYFTY